MTSTTGGDAYAETLGRNLRAARTRAGLSLTQVEQKSRGRWKAGAVGSYERGDRMVTWQVLLELAGFYGVPATALLPGDTPTRPATGEVVLDLTELAERAASGTPTLLRLARWANQVATARGADTTGNRLPLRPEHGPFLAALAEREGVTTAKLVEIMRDEWKVTVHEVMR